MTPVRTEAKADVLGALGLEKVKAVEEDPLRRWTLCLTRHSSMLVRDGLREFLPGTHLAQRLDTCAGARLTLIWLEDKVTDYYYYYYYYYWSVTNSTAHSHDWLRHSTFL
jgi:hypothetical protein